MAEFKPGAIPLRERRTFAERWEDYRRQVLPGECSPVQLAETRQAFYAGALSMYGVINADMDPGDDPTELDLAHFASIMDEVECYLKSLIPPSSDPPSCPT